MRENQPRAQAQFRRAARGHESGGGAGAAPAHAAPTGGAGGLQDSIAQLDAQLQQLADQLTQAESTKQVLQAQYDEASALLAQLIQAHEQSGT